MARKQKPGNSALSLLLSIHLLPHLSAWMKTDMHGCLSKKKYINK